MRRFTSFVRQNNRVLAVLLVPLVIVGLWALLTWHLEPQNAGDRQDVLVLLAQIVAGIVLAIGVWYTARRVAATEQAVEVSREGQITERFTRAIDQLGSGRMQIRLGGIYALERIARHSREDHWPIMEILTAFVRDKAAWKEGNGVPDGDPPRPPQDIQSALTVLGRRERSHETERSHEAEGQHLDLRNTDLRGADLSEAHLEGARLVMAHLEGALLTGTHLEGAWLDGAHLEGARLFGAHLEGAGLDRAHLEGARLFGAHLERAWLDGAHLERAWLDEAHLEDAWLDEAHLEGVDLSGVSGLTTQQLSLAFMDDKTRLPDDLEYDLAAHLERQRARSEKQAASPQEGEAGRPAG